MRDAAPAPAHVQIRHLQGWDELNQCVHLQEHTWGRGFSDRVPATMLHLGQRIGGLAIGAFDDADRMLGFVFGLPGVVNGELVHWSDMLAVHPDHRDRGIGVALKRAQRDALLEKGVQRACWTFEPLEARNAYLNFARLGVTAREYIRDFYGDTDSPLHQIIGTDRLVAEWDLASERVTRRVAGDEPAPTAPDTDDVPLVNPPGDDQQRSSPPLLDLADPILRLVVPSDIQTLIRVAPEWAAEWRRHTRAVFEAYLGRGYVVTDFVRGAQRAAPGWYVCGAPDFGVPPA